MIWLKSWLNHVYWFDMICQQNSRFETFDLIRIWFELMNLIWDFSNSQIWVWHWLRSYILSTGSHYFIGSLLYKTVEDWRYCYMLMLCKANFYLQLFGERQIDCIDAYHIIGLHHRTMHHNLVSNVDTSLVQVMLSVNLLATSRK